MGFSGVVSLKLLSGCSRISLLLFVWALLLYLGITCWWLLCWWVLPSSGLTGIHNSHLVLYVIMSRAKVKWSKTAGEYSMGFKVLTNRGWIEGPLEKYCNNRGISPN